MNLLASVKLVCCIGVSEDELYTPALLRHFVHHYLGLGVPPQNFLLTLHATHDQTNLADARRHLAHFEIEPSASIFGEYDCYRFYESNYSLMANCAPDDWIMMVDFDEFVEFPRCLPEFLETLESEGRNLVMGSLVDRLAPNGQLTAIQDQSAIWDQYPEKFRVTRDLVRGLDQKTCIFKNLMRPNLGHHEISDSSVPLNGCSRVLNVHHFKWDSTLPARLRKTLDRFNRNTDRYSWYQEVERVLACINGDRLRLDNCQRIK